MRLNDKIIDYIVVFTIAGTVGTASIIYHQREAECTRSSAPNVVRTHQQTSAHNYTSPLSVSPVG